MIRRIRGLTLVELMIVVIVVGILAAVAYPSYRDFASRGKRNEAKAALLQIATNQERWYLNNNIYTCNLNEVGVQPITGSGTYAVAINTCTANGFTATATYQRADAEAGRCLTFTIDGSGQRASTPEANCWTRTR